MLFACKFQFSLIHSYMYNIKLSDHKSESFYSRLKANYLPRALRLYTLLICLDLLDRLARKSVAAVV